MMNKTIEYDIGQHLIVVKAINLILHHGDDVNDVNFIKIVLDIDFII